MAKCNIDICLEDDRWQAYTVTQKIPEIIEAALTHLKISKPIETTVLLTDDKELKSLNKKFRGQNKPTNVLSFPCFEPEELVDIKQLPAPVMIGDIALALETIMEESVQQSKTIDDHVTHLVVHGLLHLLGYDHEVDEDAQAMEALEVEILSLLNINNPYE